MLAILCTGASFVKKNSCLVAIIVSFNTAGLYFSILEPYPSKGIELDIDQSRYLTLITLLLYSPIKSYLNQWLQVF